MVFHLAQESRLENALARLDKMSADAEKSVAATEAAFRADVNSVRELVVGSLVKRLSALESAMTRQVGSSTSNVARSKSQGQVPVTFHADSTSASDSRAVLEAEPNDTTALVISTRGANAAGVPRRLSLQVPPRLSSQAMAASASTAMHAYPGTPAASKAAVKLHSLDSGGNHHRALPGSVLPPRTNS